MRSTVIRLMMTALTANEVSAYHATVLAITYTPVFLACPRSCSEVFQDCLNNTKCNEVYENYSANCSEVINWNGDTNLTQPMCTTECKSSIDQLTANPISRDLKCCACDATDQNKKMECFSHKENINTLCNFNHSNECQKIEKECNEESNEEGNANRRGMHL